MDEIALWAAAALVYSHSETVQRLCAVTLADLRWNNIGLVGGRALLAAFNQNKTLTRLPLAGNNVPADVLQAIGM